MYRNFGLNIGYHRLSCRREMNRLPSLTATDQVRGLNSQGRSYSYMSCEW